MEKDIKEWLKDNGDGSGSGSGYGYGDGDGYGSGDGYGYGSGYGYGDGSGDGDGYGSGDGYGYGSGYGYGIGSIGGKEVFLIDGVQTIVEHIKDSFAKGYILNDDFTLTPCFVVKGHGYFAHGRSLKEAAESLRAKIFEDMDSEEAIEEFIKKFKKSEKYPGTEFFEWHHYLTGSCLMGRESFVENKGLCLEDEYSVDEFIKICENDYGSEIIKQLKEKWEGEADE